MAGLHHCSCLALAQAVSSSLSAPWKNKYCRVLEAGDSQRSSEGHLEHRAVPGDPKPYCGTSCEQQLGNRASAIFRNNDAVSNPLLSFLQVKNISWSSNSLGRTSILLVLHRTSTDTTYLIYLLEVPPSFLGSGLTLSPFTANPGLCLGLCRGRGVQAFSRTSCQ